MRARLGLLAAAAWLVLLTAWSSPAAATAVIGTFSGFLSEFNPGPIFSDSVPVSGRFTYDTDKVVATAVPFDTEQYVASDAFLSADIGGIHIDDSIGSYLITIRGSALGTDFGMRPIPDGRSGDDNTIPGSWIRLNLLGVDGGVMPDSSLPTTTFDVHLIDQPYGFVRLPPETHQSGLTIFYVSDLTIRTVDVDEPGSLWLLMAPLLALIRLPRRA